jgi:Rieske Fe-S protein
MQTEPAVASRRNFVRTFVLGSATTVVGSPWIGTLLATLAGESQAQAAQDGSLTLALSSFTPLQFAYGSVRVSVQPLAGSYPSGDFYPIILSRGPGNLFYAVSSNCPHRGCVVLPFDGSVISCPCHGSEFDMDGTITRGPATENLVSYPITFDGVNTLRITVPGLGYAISCSAVTGYGSRLRLDFPSITGVQYQVQFRSSSKGAWNVAAFAITAGGAATNTAITGTGSSMSVFVDRTTATGFYCVSMVVKEV